MSGKPAPSLSVPARLPRMWPRQVAWSLLLLAAALRLPGLWTDFWLDEIWSWTLVWDWQLKSRVNGITSIFTDIHQDNNNYLNTVFLYLCGPSAPLAVYRLPAYLAGIATVWLGGMLAVRWTQGRGLNEVTAWLAGMGLLATSQVEVVYSSEARGYALAGCAALATQWMMGSLLRSGKWLAALGYALLACVGFLSHLSFLPVLLSQAVWSLAALIWSRHTAGSWKSLFGKLTIAFGLPALLVGWLWWVDLSRANVGGGPNLDAWLVACDTVSMPFGASLPESFSLPCAVLMAALVVTGLWMLRGVATLEGVGLISLTIIAPAVLFGMAPAGLVYPRHFLVSLSVLIPVAGIGMARWLDGESPLLRLAGIVAVSVWCLGNGSELVRFWIAGRGQYQAALEHIAAGTSGRLTGVGGDVDFRNSMVMTFYQSRLRKYRALRFVPQSVWNQYPPDWIFDHEQARDPQFAPEIQIMGVNYVLDGVFPYAGPVGWHWATYRLKL